MPTLALNSSDALALSMVAVLSFALGMILTILVMMIRSGREKPDYNEELFLPENEEPNIEVGDLPTDNRAPWEQDPDWWKK